MQAFPHYYEVNVAGAVDGNVELTAESLTMLVSASPAEFDGPGDRWSPEMLLVAAVGDCLVLTFRAVARASKLPWTALRCRVAGTLDRVDRITQFTAFAVHATLDVPMGVDPERARRALEKAEQNCLIANSLKAPIQMLSVVEVSGVGSLTRAGA
jgi:organic hydroperoxide reductase OsmC/OhrA